VERRFLRWWVSLPIVLATLLPALLTSCAPEPPAAPRLVVLYATCTLNRSFLSPYEPSIAYTPEIGRFEGESVTFTRHHSEAGQSGIAFASIFTGTQAPRHGVYAHPKEIPEDRTLIAEAFAAAGFETFSWLAHPMASAGLGYAQGVAPEHRAVRLLRAKYDPTFQGILDRLDRDPDYRAFVMVNFTVTHGPYGQVTRRQLKSDVWLETFCERFPSECAIRTERGDAFRRFRALYYERANPLQYDFEETISKLGLGADDVEALGQTIDLLYKPGVHHLDRLFGDLLGEIRARDLMDSSVIAFTADHGEVMRRPNAFFFWSHGYQQAPEVIGVPLMIHAPGIDSGRYRGVTRSIDVFPTLAGLSGIALPETRGLGEDLSEALREGTERGDLLAFSHTSVLPHVVVERDEMPPMKNFGAYFPRRDPILMWVSVRRGDFFYKLRRLGDAGFEPAVFDLQRDPEETTNLFDSRDREQAEIFGQLETYRQRLLAGFHHEDGGADALPRDEQAELLKSLGYIE